MGNSCQSFVAAAGGSSTSGLSQSQRTAAMEKYRITETQLQRVEGLFKQSASNKKYLTFKDFRGLYSDSRFDHDEEDIVAVFKALGEPSISLARKPKPGRKLTPVEDRITFDGFVRLTLLCRNGQTESPGDKRNGTGSHRKRSSSISKPGGSDDADNNNGGGGGDCLDGTTVGDEVEDLIDQDRMRVLFNVMDSDCSGTISESEFHRFILNFVDDKTTASGIFGKLDHDKNRTIDFDEFCAFCRRHRKVFRAMCSYVLPID